MAMDELTRLILRHLVENPDAGDSLEGIASWWITQSMIKMKTEEVAAGVEQLLREQVLFEKQVTGGPTLYYLNKEKLPWIKQLLFKGDESDSRKNSERSR